MYPIHLPAAPPPSAAVVEAEAAIIAEEGHFHVAGHYHADEHCAVIARRREAERRLRREALLAHFCAFCNESFRHGDRKVQAGGREIHAECEPAYDAFTSPARAVA